MHLTKPIIQQLFDKKIGLINFPHGVDARLTCAGNKTFSSEHFTLQPKSFPTSASKKSEKKGVRLATGEKKGPLQLLAEPIIEEQVAMRDGAPIPKGLKVIDFIDLTGGEFFSLALRTVRLTVMSRIRQTRRCMDECARDHDL